MTYVEQELIPLGYHLVTTEKKRIEQTTKVILSLCGENFEFNCTCPDFPTIKGLGCPLHHEGPGRSAPVENGKVLANEVKRMIRQVLLISKTLKP